MRSRLHLLALGLVTQLAACKQLSGSGEGAALDSASSAALASSSPEPALRGPAPISSEAVALARSIQASKLQLVPLRQRQSRVVFGSGVLGQLTASELVVRSSRDLTLRARVALDAPRALLSLADGALLAADSSKLVRFDPSSGHVKPLGRPLLLPDAELLADAMRADRVWVFTPGVPGSASASSSTLSSLVLEAATLGVALPEQTLQLGAGGSDVLGATREGVWIHWSAGHAERFGPGGARLSGLKLPPGPALVWALPAKRVDQCYLVDEKGQLSRALVSPVFRQLASVRVSGTPLAADVGDEGRLIALVVVSGPGPSFELQLFDADLRQTAKVALPADAPTGDEDWVRVVTENQGVSVAPREALVAVGGPARVLLFNAQGQRILSNDSR